MTSVRLITFLIAITAAFALAGNGAHAQCILESIEAPDGLGNVGFGIELSVGGDRFVVSSRFATGVEEDTGTVHSYRRIGRTVEFEQSIVSPVGSVNDRFGWSTAIEGDRMVVGAPLANDGRGAAYAYSFENDRWEFRETITIDSLDVGAEFGRSVALRGNYLLIGAPRDHEAGVGAGAAFVFHYDGYQWQLDTKLLPDADTNGGFGWNVAVYGDHAAVSAHLDDDAGLDAGAVYILRRMSGEWRHVTKLTASDALDSAWFGAALSFTSELLLVGARNHAGRGAAYLFSPVQGIWTEEARFEAADADLGDGFGSKCAVSDDRVIITSANDLGTDYGVGATYLFTRHEDGWAEESKFTMPDSLGGDRFGGAIAITKKIALIAGSFDDGRNGKLFVHHLLRAECRCMAGKVNSGVGPIRDVLFVNGSTGGASRKVLANEGELLTAYVLEPPAGGHGKFVIHANAGVAQRDSIVIMPSSLGAACFPLLSSQGSEPIAIWNSIGRQNEIGESQYFDGSEIPEPKRAPAILFQLNNGDLENLPAGTVITFQGAIGDPGAPGDKEGAVTNAVVLEIR